MALPLIPKRYFTLKPIVVSDDPLNTSLHCLQSVYIEPFCPDERREDDHRHIEAVDLPKVRRYFVLKVSIDHVTGKDGTRLDLKQPTFDEVMPRIAVIMVPVIEEGTEMSILNKKIIEMDIVMLQLIRTLC